MLNLKLLFVAFYLLATGLLPLAYGSLNHVKQFPTMVQCSVMPIAINRQPKAFFTIYNICFSKQDIVLVY